MIRKPQNSTHKIESFLPSIADYDSSEKYIDDCFEKYSKEKSKILNSYNIFDYVDFIQNFRKFIKLDWQNIVLDLIKKENKCVVYFFAFLEQKGMLPSNLFDCYAFQQYQDFITNTDYLKKIFEENEILTEKGSVAGTAVELKKIPENSMYYVLSFECGSFIKSLDQSKEYSFLAISTNVILLTGNVSFLPALDNDEVVYIPVLNLESVNA